MKIVQKISEARVGFTIIFFLLLLFSVTYIDLQGTPDFSKLKVVKAAFTKVDSRSYKGNRTYTIYLEKNNINFWHGKISLKHAKIDELDELTPGARVSLLVDKSEGRVWEIYQENKLVLSRHRLLELVAKSNSYRESKAKFLVISMMVAMMSSWFAYGWIKLNTEKR